MDAAIRGCVLALALAWVGDAAATPCHDVNLTGTWLSLGRGGVYDIAQDGCSSMTLVDNDNNITYSAVTDGTTINAIPSDFFAALRAAHGYNVGTAGTYSVINHGASMERHFRSGLLQGTGNLRYFSMIAPAANAYIHGMRFYRRQTCGSDEYDVIPAISVVATISNGALPAAAHRILRRYGVRGLGGQHSLRGMSYADTLIKIDKSHRDHDHVSGVEERCVSTAEARGLERPRLDIRGTVQPEADGPGVMPPSEESQGDSAAEFVKHNARGSHRRPATSRGHK